jgi:adenosylcobinamide-phosphate synthase
MDAGLLAAFALDRLLSEPPERWHPVCWMGRAVAAAEGVALAGSDNRRRQRIKGIAAAAALPLGTWWLSRQLLKCLPHPWGTVTETVVMATALAGRSLYVGAREVETALDESVAAGRSRVARLVGRDTAGLDEAAVVRAAVESVAENANDGVVAPIFYAWVGGAPLALAYKMVNTLDSMIGYRHGRYRDFGWAAARLDDVAGFVPARLTAAAAVITAPLAGGSPGGAVGVWRRDASGHASPNAGVCEASFAGALGVRLGGRNYYRGRPVEGHVMGAEHGPPGRDDIGRAAVLMYAAASLVAVTAALVPRPRLRRKRRF